MQPLPALRRASTLAAAAAMAVGLSACDPSSLGAGHFNADKLTDLGVAVGEDNRVDVFLGRGDGAFGFERSLSTQSDPGGLVVGRFLGEDVSASRMLGGVGTPGLTAGANPRVRELVRDIAVANEGSDSVSVFVGNGNGAFQDRRDTSTGDAPVALAQADLNRDGRMDLLSANAGAGTVSALRGRGNGTFLSKLDSPTGASPRSVAVADFNRDGLPDAVTGGSGGASVLVGKGDGTFKAPQTVATGASPGGLTVGDVNRDGRADVVIANAGDDTLSVLLGNGNATFKPKVDFATGDNPVAVALGTFDAGATLDVAVANRDGDSVSVFRGQGGGTGWTLSPKTDFATPNDPVALVVDYLTVNSEGDDRALDIATANGYDESVSVLVGRGDGSFSQGAYLTIGD